MSKKTTETTTQPNTNKRIYIITSFGVILVLIGVLFLFQSTKQSDQSTENPAARESETSTVSTSPDVQQPTEPLQIDSSLEEPIITPPTDQVEEEIDSVENETDKNSTPSSTSSEPTNIMTVSVDSCNVSLEFDKPNDGYELVRAQNEAGEVVHALVNVSEKTELFSVYCIQNSIEFNSFVRNGLKVAGIKDTTSSNSYDKINGEVTNEEYFIGVGPSAAFFEANGKYIRVLGNEGNGLDSIISMTVE